MKFGSTFALVNSWHIAALVFLLLFSIIALVKNNYWSKFLLSCSILLLALAYFEPQILLTQSSQNKGTKDKTALLLDISDSIPDSIGQKLLTKAVNLAGDSEISVIPFAKGSAPYSQKLNKEDSFSEIRQRWSNLNTSATDILAMLKIPELDSYTQALLVSDGFDNIHEFEEADVSLNDSIGVLNIPITPVVLDTGEIDASNSLSISLEHINFDFEGETPDLKLSIFNPLPSEQTSAIELYYDGRALENKTLNIPAASSKSITFKLAPLLKGVHPIELRVKAKGSESALQRSFITGIARDKTLLIVGSAQDGRLLSPLFKALGDFSTTVNLQQRKVNPDTIHTYSTIFLSNVSATQLGRQAINSIREAVSNGSKLIVAGGNRAFGLGRYPSYGLDQVLPVKSLPPQKEQRALNKAVMLVVDKSRSMAESSKMQFVKEAAKLVVKNLNDKDLVGIIGFDTNPFEVVKLTKIAGLRDSIAERIGRIHPNRKTNPLPALDMAYWRLKDTKAGVKHIIFLTDGKIPDASSHYREIINKMRFAGITLSSVMLGPQSFANQVKELSDFGGGKFYQTSDPRKVPNIFLNDVKVASGELTVKQSSDYPVSRRSVPSPLSSQQSFPALIGYVKTESKPNATIELTLRDQKSTAPLLASWKFGKGTAIAFTSDANGRWSKRWAQQDIFSEFWQDILDNNSQDRRDDGKPLADFSLKSSLAGSRLVLEAIIYDSTHLAPITGTLSNKAKESQKAYFKQISPGYYRSSILLSDAGDYTLELSNSKARFPELGIHVPSELFGEGTFDGFQRDLLAKIANLSGASINQLSSKLAKLTNHKPTSLDLDWIFLIASLVFAVLAVWTRENPGVLNLGARHSGTAQLQLR